MTEEPKEQMISIPVKQYADYIMAMQKLPDVRKEIEQMTNQEAIEILLCYYEVGNEKQNDAMDMAIEALKAEDAKDAKSMPSQLPSDEIIYKQDAIDVLDEFQESVENGTPCYAKARVEMCNIPSARPDVEEKLYQYKCYITDQEGLQHEVIHVGDIRRVTGWEI